MMNFGSFFAFIAFLLSSICIKTSDAHGYVTISRNLKCKNGSNFACGSITYEPQSLEAPKGFPGAGPADGVIASAGIGRFSTLDEQTPFRWTKTSVSAGPFDFTWLFTANHRTTGYEYYITKPGWNPEAILTRDQFDLTPFCTVNSGGVQPPLSGDTHNCVLPPRNGYHVILAVWIIDDTAAAFYNMIDVQYGGANPPTTPTTPPPIPAPTPVPVASPSTNLPTPIPPPPGTLCSFGLPLEAVNDCTAFVYCSNGSVTPGTSPVSCGNGLLFNNDAQICDWDYNVNCASGTVNPETPSPIAAPVATSSPVAAPIPSSAVCASGQSLEPVENCSAFVHCVNGQQVPDSKTYCPSGLLFSSTTLVCDWPSNVNCN